MNEMEHLQAGILDEMEHLQAGIVDEVFHLINDASLQQYRLKIPEAECTVMSF